MAVGGNTPLGIADVDDSKERTSVIPADKPEIDIAQLAGAVRGRAAVVGVRKPNEYVAGHVAVSRLTGQA